MPESVNALEQYYRDLGPATANANFLAQGRRANVAQRSMPGPTMQAANTQLAKELGSMGDRGAIPDLINRGLIANTAGLPVDMLNTVLQSLGLGAEQPVGGSDSIRRALEYYGLSSDTQRPMLETLTGLTPPRAVLGAARAAGQGAEAVGRAAAPVAGQAIENYLVRSGGILPMISTKEGRIPETASDVSKLSDLLAKRADSAKIDYIHDKSKISPSEYFQFTKPDGEPVKLRISNHLEVYKGNDLSVDPQSKITFEEAIKSLQNSGIPIPNKAIADKSMQTKINKLYSNLDKKLPIKMMDQLWNIDSIKDQKQKYEALLKLNNQSIMIDPTDYKSAHGIEPPHSVRDKEKVLQLTNSMEKSGWEGRPILTYDVGRGDEALTGSHRIAAAKKANIEVPVYRIENAGNQIDENGKSIHDLGFMSPDEQINWLNKFGHQDAANLLKQEPDF